MSIDKNAIVSDKAVLGENVSVGPFSIIEENVVIGDDSQIGSHVLIKKGTQLGPECRIFKGVVLGEEPQDLTFKERTSGLIIGRRNIIREYCTLHRATKENENTIIGDDNYLMAYAHVAHDCKLGNNIILANAVNMAGHVAIDDWTIIGGIVPIHQFVQIGKHSFVGGGYRVPKDVPPYLMAVGEPLMYGGLNIVGLRRRGYSKDTIYALKEAYRVIYKSNLNVYQAIEQIKLEMEIIPEIQEVLNFISRSERGIM